MYGKFTLNVKCLTNHSEQEKRMAYVSPPMDWAMRNRHPGRRAYRPSPRVRRRNGLLPVPGGRFSGAGVSSDHKEFWSSIPEKAEHPLRIPILAAFRRIAEPLSAIDLVDVLDGRITMWEAEHHLRVLDALEVAEPFPAGRDPHARRNALDLPYRLTGGNAGEDG